MKRFRILVVGCGGMSRAWLEYAVAREDAEIVGLVDIKVENAEAKAKQFGLTVPCSSDLDAALTGTGANLVFDVTVPESHTAVTRKAFRAGCDVFGEKPLSSSIDEARETVREAARSGRTYSVMQHRRFLKGIRAYRDCVGRLGDIGIVNADFYIGAHFGGFRDLMESPLVLDMAIHTFDQARFLCGADPVSAWCREFNPGWSWYKGAASAVCVFGMSDGSVFTYRGSWCAEGAPTSWEASWRIIGSLGTGVWDGSSPPFAELVQPSPANAFTRDVKRVEAPGDWQGREGHQGALDEMFRALLEGRKAETDCADNLKSLEMVFAAKESARTGKTMHIALPR